MDTKKIARGTYSFVTLLGYWGAEVAAFVCLPLGIYAVVLPFTGSTVGELIRLPELMFASVVLFGEAARRLNNYYSRFENFELTSSAPIALSILGIVISSVMLTMTLLEKHAASLKLPEAYFDAQATVFGCAILWSLFSYVLDHLEHMEKFGFLEKRTE